MSDRQADVARLHVADVSGQEAEFNRELGERVRRARQKAGLTQEQLARRLEVARGSIANVERGMQALSAYRLARLAAVLDCPSSDLLPTINRAVAPVRHMLSEGQQTAVERTLRAAAKRQPGVRR